jgi:hypothetical protein
MKAQQQASLIAIVQQHMKLVTKILHRLIPLSLEYIICRLFELEKTFLLQYSHDSSSKYPYYLLFLLFWHLLVYIASNLSGVNVEKSLSEKNKGNVNGMSRYPHRAGQQ